MSTKPSQIDDSDVQLTADSDHRPTIDTAAIDRLSLEQALRDFEVANVRVVDLTARLTAMHQQMLELQQQSSLAHSLAAAAEALQSQTEFERNAARTEVASLRVSRSYRIGNLLVRAVKTVTP